MDYDKRLAIIVPYRNRAEHLATFVRHVESYFQRDKLDRKIDYAVHVVEQADQAPFNRGKLLNVGFALAAPHCDYVVFHDVDYLPVWTDYSCGPLPARLIWHGLTLREDPERFFGAVTLFPNDTFRQVNGYSNEYQGWGFEDTDLLQRLALNGLGFEKRDGTYIPLPHPHNGVTPAGQLTDAAQANRRRYAEKIARLADEFRSDGLANLRYAVKESGPLASVGGFSNPRFVRHLVDLVAA